MLILFKFKAYMSIDIIIAFYNPPNNWSKIVFNQFNQFNRLFSNNKVSLILVNDGSENNIIRKEVEYLKDNIQNLHYISYPKNMGKGFALRKGVSFSQSDFQIITDIDLPYAINSMLDVYHSLKNGNDIVVGVRHPDYYIDKPFFRVILSKLFRLFIKYILILDVSDTQCGLKGFNQKGKEVFLKTMVNSFLFDLEFLLISKRMGLSVFEQLVMSRNSILLTNFKIQVLLKELYYLIILCFKTIFKQL